MLAAILRGAVPPSHAILGQDVQQLLIAQARREGVAGLLHARLSESAEQMRIPASLQQASAHAAQLEAVRSLRLESYCRRILAHLDEENIPVLLLKGSALAYWAYSAPYLRPCSDIDLLVRSRADAKRVQQILSRLGYHAPSLGLPGDLVCFELTLTTEDPSLAPAVDLHWRLSSAPMFACRLGWEELTAEAIELPTLAPNARGLGLIHAYLHACMHRVQNIAIGQANRLKWLFDLKLLGNHFQDQDWERLASLAIERNLARACLDGAESSAALLGDLMPEPVRMQLQNAARHDPMDLTRMHQWWYIQRMNLAAFPTLKLKSRWVRQRLLPDPRYLKARYGTSLTTAVWTRLRAAWARSRT
ncbi:nucleotidyltransferase family protein [Denitratimonas sp. CY0512]|uniref:nucleotidyltransferase domain-containing protein n=1 Tax=Denitratimonas sp. CY0512 TaxID=3131940 RepID=UPI00309A2AA1